MDTSVISMLLFALAGACGFAAAGVPTEHGGGFYAMGWMAVLGCAAYGLQMHEISVETRDKMIELVKLLEEKRKAQ